MLTDPENKAKGGHAQQKCGVQYDTTFFFVECEARATYYIELPKYENGWEDAARLRINADKGTRYAY